MRPIPIQILSEACQKFSYQFEIIDEFTGYLAEVSNGKKSFYAGTGSLSPFPLNQATPHRLAGDKAHTRKLLKKKGFEVPEGDHFFLRSEYKEYRPDGKERVEAFIYADKLSYPVFVKPNNSSFGLGCELISTKEQLQSHLEYLAQISHIALIERPITGTEYRIFVLDGEVQFIYSKDLQKIIGDGTSPIQQLIKIFNAHIISPRGKIQLQSPFLQKNLKENNLTLDSILSEKEPFAISPRANITTGGEILFYTEEIPPITQEWIKKLTKVSKLRVFGVDLFADDLADPNTFTILEINANPGLNGVWELGKKEKVFAIWKQVFEKYFGEN